MLTMIFNTNDTPMYLLTAKKKKVELEDCPIGLFLYKDMLCIKTEDFDNERPKCFIVSTGEILLNANEMSNEDYRNLKVKPVKSMDLIKHSKK